MCEQKFSLINIENVDLGDAPKYVYKLCRTCLASGLYLVQPFRDRWEAKTRVIAATADAETSQIVEDTGIEKRLGKIKGDLEVASFQERVAARAQFQNERRQRNVENVAAGALEFPEEVVSDQPVNPDWIAQCFENCQDVSDPEMQSIWSQILAGEVAQPGRFSLRTLHAVKMLRKDDARLFTTYCRFVWHFDYGPSFFFLMGMSPLFPNVNDVEELSNLYEQEGITTLSRLHLRALNLVETVDVETLTIQCTAETAANLHYHERTYSILDTPGRIKFYDRPIPAEYLTDIGRELALIAGAKPSYCQMLCSGEMKKGGVSC